MRRPSAGCLLVPTGRTGSFVAWPVGGRLSPVPTGRSGSFVARPVGQPVYVGSATMATAIGVGGRVGTGAVVAVVTEAVVGVPGAGVGGGAGGGAVVGAAGWLSMAKAAAR
jgi:hypothetical protein